jgi:hypothetical protein
MYYKNEKNLILYSLNIFQIAFMLLRYLIGKLQKINYLKMERICKWMVRLTQIRNQKKGESLLYSRFSVRVIWLWKGGKSYYIARFPWGKVYYIAIFPGGKSTIWPFFRGERWLGGKATIQHRIKIFPLSLSYYTCSVFCQTYLVISINELFLFQNLYTLKKIK